MLNKDYFIEALQSGVYKKLDWVIDCFTVSTYDIYEEVDQQTLYPYQLVKSNKDDQSLYFVDSVEKTITKLKEYTPNQPLLRFKDKITLEPNTLPNVKHTTHTTYGNAFVNMYILVYAFGDKIPFITGRIKGSQIESVIANKLKAYDPNVDPATRDKQFIYVDELIKHNNAVSALEGLAMVAVPSVSVETMLPTPGVLKLRDELLQKHMDDLNNPAVIADIMKQLVEYEKQQLKGTDAEGFYIKAKSYDVIRMKRFIMYGLEGGFGGESPHLITRSLKEGWDMNEFPAMVDGLRGGSYSRGAETAIGGEWVKHFQRVFQNIKVVEKDCGSKHGMSWQLTDFNYKRFVGLYQITPTGTKLLDEDTCKSLIGKSILVRTPMLCKTQAPNFCETCCGEAISASANALHSITSKVGSVFLMARMKSMHGKATVTRDYHVQTAIS